MRLHAQPFEMIAQGKKTVELRLNDEKRQLIAVGDEIEFVQLPDQQDSLVREVIGLVHAPSLRKLAERVSLVAIGWSDDTNPDDAERSIEYYTRDEIKKYGWLAIELK